MGNKKLIEKILFCLGILFLFVGLWRVVDFRFFNKYILIASTIILTIPSYFIAKKDLFNSKTISSAFSIISLGLAITSIYMASKMYKPNTLDWLVIILIGLIILAYLLDFNTKMFYYIGSIYHLIAIFKIMSYDFNEMFIMLIFTFIFATVVIQKHTYEKNKDWIIPVSISLLEFILFMRWFSLFLLKILKGSVDERCIAVIIVTSILGCIIYLGNINLPKGVIVSLKTILSMLILITTYIGFWELLFPILILQIIFVSVITIISLYWHIRGAMDGKSISIIAIILQFIVTSLNILKFASFDIFAVFIGLGLIVIAVIISKVFKREG